MTTDEIIEGMMDGSLDTCRWEDALKVAKNLHERNGLRILGALDAGQCWLFFVNELPRPGEELWDSSIYKLDKGGFLTDIVEHGDSILTHEWLTMPLYDPEADQPATA